MSYFNCQIIVYVHSMYFSQNLRKFRKTKPIFILQLLLYYFTVKYCITCIFTQASDKMLQKRLHALEQQQVLIIVLLLLLISTTFITRALFFFFFFLTRKSFTLAYYEVIKRKSSKHFFIMWSSWSLIDWIPLARVQNLRKVCNTSLLSKENTILLYALLV